MQAAVKTTAPFWARRFSKTAFLFYLALVICILLKQVCLLPNELLVFFDVRPQTRDSLQHLGLVDTHYKVAYAHLHSYAH